MQSVSPSLWSVNAKKKIPASPDPKIPPGNYWKTKQNLEGEAIKLFQAARKNGKPLDVVFMDITVPGGMGGKEAIKEMLAVTPNVRAIVSSGYARDPIMSNYKQSGSYH